MPQIFVTKLDGEQVAIDAMEGLTVMEAIRDSGVPGLLATCGGCCACATCHIKIDAGFGALFPTMQDDERDLLDTSLHSDDQSRLSCQLPITAAIEGLRVQIAEPD